MCVIQCLRGYMQKVLEQRPNLHLYYQIMKEDRLWERGVINLDMPVGLLKTVFFYNGKNFCLREQEEHRSLMISQQVYNFWMCLRQSANRE